MNKMTKLTVSSTLSRDGFHSVSHSSLSATKILRRNKLVVCVARMIRSMHQMLTTFATALLTVVSVAQAFGPGCAPHLRPIQHKGRFPSIRFSATPITRLRGSAAPVKYGELQHCGVLVDDVETAVKFYTEVLGMQDVSETRPSKLDYPGAFLQAGCNQVHLMKVIISIC